MVLYRPFLFFIAKRKTDVDFDFRGFACASACIKAAMQVVWLDEMLEAEGLLTGPAWFLYFTTFVAVVSSIMFVVSNKDDPTAQEYFSAAQRGYRILEKSGATNQTAKNYADSLKVRPRSGVPRK